MTKQNLLYIIGLFAPNVMSFFGSPSRVCKERSDGIAIVRTFQPPLHLSKPQVRNRVTYDPSEAKAYDGQKKTPLNVMSIFGSPSRVCKERSDGIAIVRTFQPPPSSLNRKSAIASPTTRRRRKPARDKKKTPLNVMSFFWLPE